jgi:adenylate cyclase
MSLERKEIFEFGEFRLDVNEHTIERIDGHRNGTLTEKAFQALVLLVRRRGHLVSKEELIGFVWPDAIVEDNNLEKCVHQLRHFLGETSDGSIYIETVRKHGYRFVGEVDAVEVSSSWLPETFRTENGKNGSAGTNGHQQTEPETEFEEIVEAGSPSLPVGKARFRGKSVALVLFATLLAVALAGYMLLGPSSSTVADKGKVTLAVLPSKPIDPANRNALYEIGIADSLINRLNPAKGLVVRSLSSVGKYNETEQDPIAAGREQKVDYVLASNYQIADGKIRITSRLINVATGEVEENYKFEKEAVGIFAVQDAIAADFADRLMARFGVASSGWAKTRGTTNEEAYRLYLMGMNLNDKGGAYSLKAIEYLDQAVALDPNYAAAWAGKGLAHIWGPSGGISEKYQRSTEAINKALAIDPNLSVAYTARCENKLFFEYDFDGAETACKRALDLDPNSSVAHLTHNYLLISRGRYDEGLAEIKTAIDLEPASFRNQRQYANTLYGARRYEEAAEYYKRSIDFNPDNVAPYRRLVRTLEAQGKESEAFDYLIKLSAVEKKTPEVIERFRAAYAKSGWRGVLIERIKTSEAENTGHFWIAQWYAALGDKDKAFEYLEKAYQRRDQLMMLVPNESHHFDSLRDDPRMADLIRRVKGK